MKLYLRLFYISSFFIGCAHEQKFDKEEWSQKIDVDEFPYREKMINDLITNHQLKGLKYFELIELIGEPDENIVGRPNELYYPISTEYGYNIDPVSGKTLVIVLNSDSTVKEFRVDSFSSQK